MALKNLWKFLTVFSSIYLILVIGIPSIHCSMLKLNQKIDCDWGEGVGFITYIGYIDMAILITLGVIGIGFGIFKIIGINRQRTTLPSISNYLNSNEKIIQYWSFGLKTGFMQNKHIFLTLTNQRIIVVNADGKNIENNFDLDGLSVITKNVHKVTESWGKSGTGGGTFRYGFSDSRIYGDVDFFEGETLVYGLRGIKDPEGIRKTIIQVQQN